jgi:YidC/Oxa1 family membrane protein insertase
VLEKLSVNQRMMVATVVSIIFFIVYSAYFLPEPKKQIKQQTTEQNNTHAAPATATTPASTKSTNETNNLPLATTSDNLVVVKAESFKIIIDSLGRISSKVLYPNEHHDNAVELVSTTLPKPLEMRFKNPKTNDEAFKVNYTANVNEVQVTSSTPAMVILVQQLSDVTITKTITFYEDGHYDFKIDLNQDVRYFVSPGFEPKINPYAMTVMGTLVQDSSDQIFIVEDGDATGMESYRHIGLLSAFDRYYATMFYTDKHDMNVVLSKTANDEPIAFVEGAQVLELHGYLGPKFYKTLEAIDPMLTDAIEYGFFTFLAHPVFLLLQYFYDMFGNWGWAIVMVTLVIRLVLYPLTHKGMVSMQKLKDVAPKMKELQAKYKGDPQRLNAKMMELYKKENANPLGGCLPLLLQIPVFFAIYRVLLNSIELEGAEWILWIEDLAVMDPYFVLPLLLGGSMYLQQKISPNNFTDPMQEKIFKFLPLIFTIFFLTFPAGLTLYWFVNNVFSIAQQYYINKHFEKLRTMKASK